MEAAELEKQILQLEAEKNGWIKSPVNCKVMADVLAAGPRDSAAGPRAHTSEASSPVVTATDR